MRITRTAFQCFNFLYSNFKMWSELREAPVGWSEVAASQVSLLILTFLESYLLRVTHGREVRCRSHHLLFSLLQKSLLGKRFVLFLFL